MLTSCVVCRMLAAQLEQDLRVTQVILIGAATSTESGRLQVRSTLLTRLHCNLVSDLLKLSQEDKYSIFKLSVLI